MFKELRYFIFFFLLKMNYVKKTCSSYRSKIYF